MFLSVKLFCRRRKGKFSVIWLAATRGIEFVKRSEILGVNVRNTCDQILKYAMSPSMLPSRRLPLHVSAKLFYGIVLAHHEQVRIFTKSIFDFLSVVHHPISIRKLELLDKRGNKRTCKKRLAKKGKQGMES